MSDDHFPPLEPNYRTNTARREHQEQDEEWHDKFHSQWLAWGHSQDNQEDWKFWATRLFTNTTTAKLCNHIVGKAGIPATRPITWANIAAVMANPRWDTDYVRRSDWAKRAQIEFPQANILAGHPNDNGPIIRDLTFSAEKRASNQRHESDVRDKQGALRLQAENTALKQEIQSLQKLIAEYEKEETENNSLLSRIRDASEAKSTEICRLTAMVGRLKNVLSKDGNGKAYEEFERMNNLLESSNRVARNLVEMITKEREEHAAQCDIDSEEA
ncbi:hypothetical protein FPOAC2_05481 [Fusarium poae]|uniref:Uncharacterized protein n=1 Tax=Fusarium poae TaxID=36050 RepID=A0A1B8AV34_FUSPO|nr:hypothetical protein FPOAC1_005374 [Fusarium poae]KAG8672113.1 hypothetical protein FPOAC1_005374 [Fusarium poae]OBS24320.1 hypothetical protein FPOA_04865 [Fusarium poae]